MSLCRKSVRVHSILTVFRGDYKKLYLLSKTEESRRFVVGLAPVFFMSELYM